MCVMISEMEMLFALPFLPSTGAACGLSVGTFLSALSPLKVSGLTTLRVSFFHVRGSS